jgi:hypothetical protein
MLNSAVNIHASSFIRLDYFHPEPRTVIALTCSFTRDQIMHCLTMEGFVLLVNKIRHIRVRRSCHRETNKLKIYAAVGVFRTKYGILMNSSL